MNRDQAILYLKTGKWGCSHPHPPTFRDHCPDCEASAEQMYEEWQREDISEFLRASLVPENNFLVSDP